MSRVAIAGDSWAYIWLPDKNGAMRQNNLGLARWLSKHHTVINVAEAGFSNLQAVRALEKVTSADVAVFIQTEPVREWWSDVADSERHRMLLDDKTVFDMAVEHGSVIAAMQNHLRDVVYPRLVAYSQATKTPVLLVGGCSKIDTSIVPPELQVIVPSWTEMLFIEDSTYKDHLFQDTNQWLSCRYADRVHRERNVDLMVEWFEMTRQVTDKLNYWRADERYFNPDHWHPNEAAHKRLVYELAPHINLLVSQKLNNGKG